MQKSKGVLIIDNNPVCNYMSREFFMRMEYYQSICFCRNGREALRFLKKHQNNLPELILLDPDLPFMNGYDFLSTITMEGFDKSRTKIVLFSIGCKEISLAQKKYKLEFIDKPLTAEKFYQTVGIQNTERKLVEQSWK